MEYFTDMHEYPGCHPATAMEEEGHNKLSLGLDQESGKKWAHY